MEMQDCKDHDLLIRLQSEIDPIGEALQQSASHTRFNLRELQGVFLEPFKEPIKVLEKAKSQASSLALVPDRRGFEVKLSLVKDDDAPGLHREELSASFLSTSWRTCFQGLPVVG